MEETLKKLRLIFIVLFTEYLAFSAIVFYLKQVKELSDKIEVSSKLTMIIPIIMIASILIAYFIYDRIAKKSQKLEIDDTQGQIKLYTSAMIIKMAMLNFVGLLVGIMMLMLYQKSYLYMLGIIAVFFMINFPNEVKFRRDFVKRNDIFD